MRKIDQDNDIVLTEITTTISSIKTLRLLLIEEKTYKIIGTCFVDNIDEIEPVIHSVFISEDYRKRGYSKILLDEAHSRVKSNDVATYSLIFVDKYDTNLINMYKDNYSYFFNGEYTPEGHPWMQKILK